MDAGKVHERFPYTDHFGKGVEGKQKTDAPNQKKQVSLASTYDALSVDSVQLSQPGTPDVKTKDTTSSTAEKLAGQKEEKTPGQKTKSYFDEINANAKGYLWAGDARVKKTMADIHGLSIGAALEYGLATTGVTTYLHESGHAAAVQAFYKNPSVTVQADGIDNIKNLIKSPSAENLGRVFTMHDVNQDKAAGVCRYTYGDGLNERGAALGQDKVSAIVSAAGGIVEEIPTLIAFTAGFKMRKKYPLAGYSLMSLAGMRHLSTSFYPISALWTTTAERPGHDWANFAQKTSIHPAITATVFAASLPALGVAMWAMEKSAENKKKDQFAVMLLIQKGKISVDDIDNAYKDYKRAGKLKKAQDALAEVLEKPYASLTEDKKVQKEMKKALGKVKNEYDRFSLFLADRFRDQVNEEKKHLPEPPKMSLRETASMLKDDLKGAWKKDKVGTALTTGTVVGSAAAIGKSISDVAAASTGAVVGGAAGAALSNIIPGVSLIGTASATWQARKTIKNPNAGKLDKAASVSTAAFSAISTAGLLIPGLGLPVTLVGIGGVLATAAVKALIKRFA